MIVQSKAVTNSAHKNGLCLQQRRGGRETLVQWQNGDQFWIQSHDIEGRIVLVGGTSYDEEE